MIKIEAKVACENFVNNKSSWPCYNMSHKHYMENIIDCLIERHEVSCTKLNHFDSNIVMSGCSDVLSGFVDTNCLAVTYHWPSTLAEQAHGPSGSSRTRREASG